MTRHAGLDRLTAHLAAAVAAYVRRVGAVMAAIEAPRPKPPGGVCVDRTGHVDAPAPGAGAPDSAPGAAKTQPT
jgi:hypothetical protein